MDIGHHQSVPSNKKGRKAKRKDDNSLKVVYISSPMKVRTTVSRFQSLVQELTGKDSDITQYMDAEKGVSDQFHDVNELLGKKTSCHQISSSISSDDTTTAKTTTTPTTSESLLGPIENVFSSQMVDQFDAIFSSDAFCDTYDLDVLGSYDDLM